MPVSNALLHDVHNHQADHSARSVGDPAAAGFAADNAGCAGGVGATKHILVPSHCWPHQQCPSALIKQVPVPQQRISSSMVTSRFGQCHTDLPLIFATTILVRGFAHVVFVTFKK